MQRCGPVPCDCPAEERAEAPTVQRQAGSGATAPSGQVNCCERDHPGAIPIWWPEHNNWHPPKDDPGSERPEFNVPTEPLLIKRGSGLYDPSRPEIGRYDRIISGPPFNVKRPSGWPIHHKIPLMLGGWGNDEQAAGEYGPKGEVIVAPNLVLLKPETHDAWHRALHQQPRGPRPGEGPSGSTADGTTFCVLDLMPGDCHEDRDDLAEDHLAQAALLAGRQLSEWWENRKRSQAGRAAGSRAAAAGGEAAAAAGASRLGGIVRAAGRVAAKASLVVSIAEVVVTLAVALANYAYGSIYSGTRGARLEQTLRGLVGVTETLAHEGGYAQSLEDALQLSAAEAEAADEAATLGLRKELLGSLVRLRGTVVLLSSELDQAATGFSAISGHVDVAGLDEVRFAMRLADSVIQSGDTSTTALVLLSYYLSQAGVWYGGRVEGLVDAYPAIVRADFGAWIERRR